MKNKIIIIVFFLITVVFISQEVFRRKIGGFGGSYPFVESWVINVPENEVVEAIKELKLNNNKLQPPNDKELLIGRYIYDWQMPEMINYTLQFEKNPSLPLPIHSENNSTKLFWFNINFYYSDTKEVVYTWTRPDVEDSSITTFALVGFSKLNDSTDYRLINRDFWYVANKIQIHKFKKEILQPILDKIEERKKRK